MFPTKIQPPQDLMTATPVEVDTYLRGIYGAIAKIDSEIWAARRRQEQTRQRAQQWREGRMSQRDVEQIAADEALIARAGVRRQELEELAAPSEARYDRDRWTRAFLVTNVGGHIHRHRACSTCRPTTEFAWLTEMSGAAEELIIEMAGVRACTTCYRCQ